MKEILLTQDLVTQVDDEDYEWLSQYMWFAQVTRKYKYAARNDEQGNRLYMHVAIIEPKYGNVVDHRDNNGLNNQRYNLRESTYSQNMTNMSSNRGNSIYKGVCWKRGAWVAQIGFNGPQIYLGRFRTEIAAALAYDAKARELFGEFARTNFSLEATAILQRIGYD